MKVHQLALGALKDQQEPPSLTLACKSFISGANHNVQVGTRWNPTEEQITILEALYKGGMHTPNATEIERITRDLSKYGRIEGKNVFYWFQNHKARERQRQKRNLNFVDACLRLNGEATMAKGEKMKDGGGICKRKCRSWGVRCFDEDDNKTLELFPLHPEGR